MKLQSTLLTVCLTLIATASGTPTTSSLTSTTRTSSVSTKHSTIVSTKASSSSSKTSTSSSKSATLSVTSVATTYDINVGIPSVRSIIYAFADPSHSSMSAPLNSQSLLSTQLVSRRVSCVYINNITLRLSTNSAVPNLISHTPTPPGPAHLTALILGMRPHS